MKIEWWKIIGIILLLYTIVAGTLIPLKPGIISVSPQKLNTGIPTLLEVSTYNTRLDKASKLKAWLKVSGDKLLPATGLNVSNSNHLEVTFPPYNGNEGSKKYASLVIENELDGYFLYPDAIKILNTEEAPSINSSLENISVINSVDDFKFPYRHILEETIRNTFFHVAIWFAMFILLIVSCYHSIKYLLYKDLAADMYSSSLTSVALIFGIAGLLTGSMWARYTWGTFWTADVKLNMTAIALLIYFAYWILRASITDIDTRARISSVFNLFSFVCLMILVMVIPRLSDSLHPGNGGNPAMGGEDLDNTMRAVFYPAIIGYTIIGLWISQLNYRYLKFKDDLETSDFNYD